MKVRRASKKAQKDVEIEFTESIMENNQETEIPAVDTTQRTIDVLGSVWTIKYGTAAEYPMLAYSDGYADSSVREIIICDMTDVYDTPDHKKDMEYYRRHIVRHEVTHAFLMESGLDSSSIGADHWADNEEMVDWFAAQTPKIYHAFEALGVLE